VRRTKLMARGSKRAYFLAARWNSLSPGDRREGPSEKKKAQCMMHDARKRYLGRKCHPPKSEAYCTTSPSCLALVEQARVGECVAVCSRVKAV
jgi:hypothetical protein